MRKHYPKNLEEKWQKFWEKEKIYRFLPKSKKPIFSIDTPPPYVSAEKLHAGHIMSYTQADFIARFKRQRGFNVFYPMGFDDNGLPTERFVEKKYNLRKDKTTRSLFRNLCVKESRKLIKTYKKLWKKLALSVDWSLTYDTINELSQRIAQRSFIDLFKKKKVVRKEEPVIWCPFCQTSLSQADLEDREEEGYLNYIKFYAGEEELIVATTRPELIPACVSLFFNPKDERYKHLEGKKAKIPLFEREVPIFASEDVDPNFGTGLMMVCTFGDIEDIKKWKVYNLPLRIIFDERGVMNELSGPYKGLSIQEAREKIVDDLQKRDLLQKREKIIHVVNVHERCKTPVEFQVTPQWFIKVIDIKGKLKRLGGRLKWHPPFMRRKYDDWIDGLKWDWCISRQRFYGVPFPVWYCKDKVILAEEKDLPVDPLKGKPSKKILKKYKCREDEIKPEEDVMDTWMISSLTPLINARWKEKDSLMRKIYPMSLRPQGFEIIRTWLFYTMVKAFYHTNNIPWKEVMISGWGLDEKGNKMSKSLGNIIDAEDLLSRYPSDAIRYWASGAGLGRSLRFQEKEVKKGHRLMMKIWNASRFSIMNLKDFRKRKIKKFYYLDKWIQIKLQRLIKEATDYFENYEYSKAREAIELFFWHDFCDNYLEAIKYRLYNKKHPWRVSAQNTLYKVLFSILKMFAPFLPYITEEIYQLFFKKYEKEKSIHLTEWPKKENYSLGEEEKLGDLLFEITSLIRKIKAENKVSLKKEVRELLVECSSKERKKIDLIRDDLVPLNNIKNLSFGKTNEEGVKLGKIRIKVYL